MKIRDVRCQLLTAPVPKEQQFTSDLGTVQAFHAAIVIVETDEGITGFGEAKGTPAAMKGLVEHELRP
ncbi:MAG: mandelate racemase/muconate lactonizing enzyme family protein, partial [Anaerolineae bacterium]